MQIKHQTVWRSFQKCIECCILAGLFSSLISCALKDWAAYNFSAPPVLKIIPEEKLRLQWDRSAREIKKSRSALTASLEDSEWGAAFEALAGNLYGWQPDFCRMYQRRSRSPNFITRDIEGDLGNALPSAFWKSYLRNVYYDVIETTATVQGHKALLDLVKQLTAAQDIFLKTSPRLSAKEARTKSENAHQIGAQPSANKSPKEALLEAIKAVEDSTPPQCAESILAGDVSDPAFDLAGAFISRSFLGRLLNTIDADNGGLLVDLNEEKNPEAKAINMEIDEWRMQRSSCCRALTVSKEKPASLSQSVKRPDPEPSPEKQIFFLRVADKGQAALVELASELMKAPCSSSNSASECESNKLKGLSSLVEILEKQSLPESVKSFSSMQKLELITSSAVNSPDALNRLEYVTSYTGIIPYPYPGNKGTILEDEFWMRFRALQIGKSPAERLRSLHVDLDTVWKDMMVRIENVETTVQQTPLEIAQISREATQNLQIKPQPSVELKGTVKGTLEAPVELASGVKTTVSEKLLKELDRRSTWLNSERNLLRISQRGMDAANIAGSFKEKVTLRIPSSLAAIQYVEYKEGAIKIESTNQPLYFSVPSVSISLGVVREPYKFKRSATEKFGLPDSSDARFIVVVSEPAPLKLWQWDRQIGVLTTDDLDVTPAPVLDKKKIARLAFSYPHTGAQGPLFVAAEDEKFREVLRKSIEGLIHHTQPAPGTFAASCKIVAGKPDQFYFSLKVGTSSSEIFWIGKHDSSGEMVPFNGKEAPFLEALKSSGECK